ncbi:cytochrome bd oxidase small subunit CydS [Lysinibacillus sp. KU-BSD001]
MTDFIIFQAPFIIWILAVITAFVAAAKMKSDDETEGGE